MSIERIYWDSDAFLGWLKEEPEKVGLCAGTLDRAKAGEVVIFTSALAIAEVLWMRGEERLPEKNAVAVRRFFRHSYIRVRNVTRQIAESAQELVWSNGIRPKDAIHVATALDAKTPVLETFDERLLKQTGKVGASPQLIIRKPIPPVQPRLGRDL